MKISVDKNLNIGVAVSGGADSMVLLDLLMQEGTKVSVINVDHSIRGEASRQDSSFVKDFCESRGLALWYKEVDAPGYAEREGMSIELAARELRYAFFDELLCEGKVDAVALAHHLDDQAETVLMRFFRGSGVRGLAGISDREGYIHPLLNYSKEEILAYAAERSIFYVQDDTNYDTVYRRNFIRQEVLPLIKTRYPDITKVISKNALIFAELEDYLKSGITPCKKENHGVSLPLTVLQRHPAIAKKSIAEALRAMGILKDIEYTHLESILGLQYAPSNSRINLPFGVDAVKEYNELKFIFRNEMQDYEQPFSIDGIYEYGGVKIGFAKGGEIVKGVSFDLDKLPEGAVVRTRRAGDVFRSYKGREKSLSDYLTDKKIALTQREKLLVLAKGSAVYAVLGVEIADAVKITEDTKNIIHIIAY